MHITFEAELWVWAARRAERWTFVSLPPEESDDIRELTGARSRPGFGSVRVRATVGHTSWRTSIFPDGARQTYVLPIKKAVRTAEKIDAGDSATVTVELIDI